MQHRRRQTIRFHLRARRVSGRSSWEDRRKTEEVAVKTIQASDVVRQVFDAYESGDRDLVVVEGRKIERCDVYFGPSL
jgi:hypothetical protein